VILGEDAARDVGADRDTVDALEEALVGVVVDEVDLAAGATGVGELAVRTVVEGPVALGDDTAGAVPGIAELADEEMIGRAVGRARTGGVGSGSMIRTFAEASTRCVGCSGAGTIHRSDDAHSSTAGSSVITGPGLYISKEFYELVILEWLGQQMSNLGKSRPNRPFYDEF
jgi:hypothetical protein